MGSIDTLKGNNIKNRIGYYFHDKVKIEDFDNCFIVRKIMRKHFDL